MGFFLRILRRVAAQAVATGIEVAPRWVSSEEMPADSASRRFAPGAAVKKFNSTKGYPGEGTLRPLRGAHLKQQTLCRYLRAFLFDFYPWAQNVGWAARIRSNADLDLALQEWMDLRHEQGRGAHVGKCMLYAIKALSPSIFASLVDARALLHVWNALHRTVHWPPLSLPLVLLLATDQFAMGMLGSGSRSPSAS